MQNFLLRGPGICVRSSAVERVEECEKVRRVGRLALFDEIHELHHRAVAPGVWVIGTANFLLETQMLAEPLQQPLGRVVFEDFHATDISAQRVHALVPADLDELEDRDTPGGGAGEETGPEAVAREVGWVVARPSRRRATRARPG